jgi:HlyD family secretion protein
MLEKTPNQTAASADLAAVLRTARPARKWRRFAVLGLVLLLGGGGLWYWLAATPDGGRTVYSTAPVTRGDLTVTVNATGTVEPTNQVEISSELSGTVGEVLADFNDQVTEGEVLARLNTSKLAANVDLARATEKARQASVLQAEATVAETDAVYRRAEGLQGRGVTSTQALETAKASSDRAVAGLAAARADLEIAAANLAIVETDLAKADIRSPINGIVLDRAIEPGQIVASSLSAPVLFTLAEDLSEMELQVDIDEADMAKVRTGEKASFTVEAYRDRDFPAEISEIRFSPETVEGVVTYKAILTVDNAALLLRPGMTATAEITVEKVKDALLVPNAALRYAPAAAETSSGGGSGLLGLLFRRPSDGTAASTVAADGKRTIWVLRDGVPVGVAIGVGSSDGNHTAVTGDALKEGDLVIVGAKAAS